MERFIFSVTDEGRRVEGHRRRSLGGNRWRLGGRQLCPALTMDANIQN